MESKGTARIEGLDFRAKWTERCVPFGFLEQKQELPANRSILATL
jgi:hypothetical protein